MNVPSDYNLRGMSLRKSAADCTTGEDFDSGIDAKATPKFHSFPSDERGFLEIWVTQREDCRR